MSTPMILPTPSTPMLIPSGSSYSMLLGHPRGMRSNTRLSLLRPVYCGGSTQSDEGGRVSNMVIFQWTEDAFRQMQEQKHENAQKFNTSNIQKKSELPLNIDLGSTSGERKSISEDHSDKKIELEENKLELKFTPSHMSDLRTVGKSSPFLFNLPQSDDDVCNKEYPSSPSNDNQYRISLEKTAELLINQLVNDDEEIEILIQEYLGDNIRNQLFDSPFFFFMIFFLWGYYILGTKVNNKDKLHQPHHFN
jgi:hypothetical protein